jgi:hypothetical protein
MSEEVQAPEPAMKGRFNLFETPDGGIHIAYTKDEEYKQEGEPEILHIDVPGFVINAARMAAESGIGIKDMAKLALGARHAAKSAT